MRLDADPPTATVAASFSTRINGTGLVHLRELSNLHRLSLEDTQVGNAALPYLCGLQTLTNLNLSGTRITDAGMIHLTPLADLQCLRVVRTRVTADGIRRIKQALPRLDCHGPWEDLHDPDRDSTYAATPTAAGGTAGVSGLAGR